jgi:hypothetical protein
LLKILGILSWGLENIPQDAFTRIENNEDLQVEIQITKFASAKQMKLA